MMTFQEYGIDLPSGAHGNVKTICPNCSHERKNHKDKCLSVEVGKGTWNCHHCGWRGGLAKNEHAPKIIRRPEYKPKKETPSEVVKWFADRGIPEKVLQDEKIGYGHSFKEKGGMQFPYIKGGNVVNVKHRSRDKQFRQEKDAEKCLYRFDEIEKAEDSCLIITEGEIDALSFVTVGYKSVTSIPDGAPSEHSTNYTAKFDFLKSAESLFSKYSKIILAMDNDDPGKVAEFELARRIGIERCWRIEYPDGCKDANDVLVKHGDFKLIAVAEAAKPFPVEGIISPDDLRSKVMNLYDTGTKRGYITGWHLFNEFYTVKPGEMTVVTGIPGSGKSNFVDAMIVNLIRLHQLKFAVFSPENWPPERHLQTFIEKHARKPFDRDGQGVERISKAEVDVAVNKLNEHIRFIMPKDEIMSVDSILDKAKVEVFRHGIQGLVIDPWNEIEHCYDGMREDQYISKELTKIRRFARLNGVHVWIIAHPRNLTKDSSGKYQPPTMYEISGGAHWRNKADNGLCVHRKDFRKGSETYVIVQKIRFKEVGRCGDVRFGFCLDTGVYRDEMKNAWEVDRDIQN